MQNMNLSRNGIRKIKWKTQALDATIEEELQDKITEGMKGKKKQKNKFIIIIFNKFKIHSGVMCPLY